MLVNICIGLKANSSAPTGQPLIASTRFTPIVLRKVLLPVILAPVTIQIFFVFPIVKSLPIAFPESNNGELYLYIVMNLYLLYKPDNCIEDFISKMPKDINASYSANTSNQLSICSLSRFINFASSTVYLRFHRNKRLAIDPNNGVCPLSRFLFIVDNFVNT